MTIAQRNLQVARTALDQAKERLDLVKQGPDQATIDAAQQAVDGAQNAADNAQDKLDETNSHPTPAELRAAKDRVDQAQAALTRADTPASVGSASDDPGQAFDMEIMEKGLAQEQASVAQLQQKLEGTKLLAPFAGVVTAVNVHNGDPVDPAHPVMTLSTAGAPVISVDVTEQDAAKLKVDQAASIVMDGASAPLNGSIASLKAQSGGAGRVAQVRVDWGSDRASQGRSYRAGERRLATQGQRPAGAQEGRSAPLVHAPTSST